MRFTLPSASRSALFLCVALTTGVLAGGCSKPKDKTVRAHVSGTLALSPEIDPEDDGSGFEILILSQLSGDLDTLASAVTAPGGTFAVDVVAPERGVFPLSISRGSDPLALEELVLADGDSVSIRGTFPLENRTLRIVSYENGAWAALRNTKAAFQQTVYGLVQNQTYTPETMGQAVAQTSNVLWSLRDTYPNTMGAIMAEAESIGLLESWNDSLALARFGELKPDHAVIVDLVRAARRSTARLSGQAAAIDLVNRYAGLVEKENRAGVRSELVMAHMDSSALDLAVEVARSLTSEEGDWGTWAQKAVYELENLMPGMPAPEIGLVDLTGRGVNLAALRGNVVMLEFFAPDGEFFATYEERAAIVALGDRFPLVSVSVSLEPDSLYTLGMLQEAPMAGTFVIDPAGAESVTAKAYNVNVLPTRVLIDPEGRIVGKYVGGAFDALSRDLAGLFQTYAARQQP